MPTTVFDLDAVGCLMSWLFNSGFVVRKRISDRPDWWADQIQIATMDAFRWYATVIGDVVADEVLVIDHFHAICLASVFVNVVRHRVLQTALRH